MLRDLGITRFKGLRFRVEALDAKVGELGSSADCLGWGLWGLLDLPGCSGMREISPIMGASQL